MGVVAVLRLVPMPMLTLSSSGEPPLLQFSKFQSVILDVYNYTHQLNISILYFISACLCMQKAMEIIEGAIALSSV